MIAKIAVSAAIYAIDKPYSYRVPEGMTPMVGARVSVPFGRANKRAEGVVLALTDGDESRLKPIDGVLDAEPLLDERALHMAAFLRERYFCTLTPSRRSCRQASGFRSMSATPLPKKTGGKPCSGSRWPRR